MVLLARKRDLVLSWVCCGSILGTIPGRGSRLADLPEEARPVPVGLRGSDGRNALDEHGTGPLAWTHPGVRARGEQGCAGRKSPLECRFGTMDGGMQGTRVARHGHYRVDLAKSIERGLLSDGKATRHGLQVLCES